MCQLNKIIVLFAWRWNYISDRDIECISKFNQWKQRSYALWVAVLQAIISVDGYYFIFMTYGQGNQLINFYKKMQGTYTNCWNLNTPLRGPI